MIDDDSNDSGMAVDLTEPTLDTYAKKTQKKTKLDMEIFFYG